MSEPCRTCKGSGAIMIESIKGSWEEPCPDCFQYTELEECYIAESEFNQLNQRIKQLEKELKEAEWLLNAGNHQYENWSRKLILWLERREKGKL